MRRSSFNNAPHPTKPIIPLVRALSRKFDEYDHVIRYWDVVEAQTKPAVFDIVGDRAPAPYMVRTSDFVFDEGERYPDAWTSVLRAKNIKHQNVSCTEDQKSKILGPALMAYHGMKTTIKYVSYDSRPACVPDTYQMDEPS